jgi:hypothetical protein
MIPMNMMLVAQENQVTMEKQKTAMILTPILTQENQKIAMTTTYILIPILI